MSAFEDEVRARLASSGGNGPLQDAARTFTTASIDAQYSYNFFWLSRPIIQYPQDIMAMQELVWRVRPDLIVETGIAHGGSLLLSASLLALLDYGDALERGEVLDPARSARKVIGVDIDIRAHNREAIEAHPFSRHVTMIEGSSVDPDIVGRVHELAAGHERVLVCLDSNHTHDHVLAELEAYAPLVTAGSYCVVFDSVIEDLPDAMYPDRPWSVGDNPKTALRTYLAEHPEFEIDTEMDAKLLISVAPNGYLRRRAEP